MPVGLSLILVVFFLFMNAFFVVAEFALVRVRKSQLQIAEEEGRSGAKAALRVANNVNAYLSACQLGITLASLALGWLGEPAVSELIHPALGLLNLPKSVISAIAVAIGFALITALHIVVGELIPKFTGDLFHGSLRAYDRSASRLVLSADRPDYVAV